MEYGNYGNEDNNEDEQNNEFHGMAIIDIEMPDPDDEMI